MRVKKYNKKYQEFNKNKIETSIRLAAEAVKEDIPDFMVKRLAQYIEDDLIKENIDKITAEELSTRVENKLMQSSYKNTAWSYITYHYDRQKEHLYNSDLIKAFKKKLSGINIENSNANCDERSFSGRMNEAARVLLKDDALYNKMSKTARNNHINNETYTHDQDSYSSGMHNCFDSHTEFITSNGIRQFRQFTDGEPVIVLAGDGEWREATVRNYAKQKRVQTVELEYHATKKGLDTVNIKCTPDHRWYLLDGTVTTSLKVGDKLKQLPKIKDFNNIQIITKEDAEMWCLGFILGDGCDHYEYTQVTLCNAKTQYSNIFEQAYYQVGANSTTDRISYFKRLSVNKQTFLTHRMWKMLTMRQKQLLFDGYIHADGNYNGQEYPASCSTADERILEFIKDLSCLCGYHIRRTTEVIHDTNFKKDAKIWHIDFIVNQNHTGYWIVKSITPGTHNNSSVWCVEEPVTHSFVLAGGILTGNCLSIPFDPMFKYGVAIKQTDIRAPKSISTGFQLIAVYMQVQSLQQFGGVAATHLDWTLVPYLRITFFKHLRDGHKYIKGEIFELPEDMENISIDDYVNDSCYQYAIDMTIRDTKQGAEALIHNLNSLQSRSGQQLPFSSINYGTCTSTEGRIIIDAILEAELSGTGPLHKTPIFPCCIFQYDENINGKPGTPNYDLFRKALFCTSKRLYPNYCNNGWSVNIKATKTDIEHKRRVLDKLSDSDMQELVKWVSNNKKEALNYRMTVSNNKVIIDETVIVPVEIMSTMGCRTYNGYDMNFDFNVVVKNIIKNGEPPKNYFYTGNQKDGRGNIAPATIILPTIAMQSKGKLGNKNIEDFMSRLTIKIDECRDALVDRFTHIASQPPTSATFMYFNNTMLGYVPEEGIISALKHGTLAVGQIGLAECLQILIGKDHTTTDGMNLAKQIEELFNTKVNEFKHTKYEILDQSIYLNFGVYYTPAESLCHTACMKFKEKYGELPNISDKEFFTNSMHIPVWHSVTPFEKIDLESQLTGYSNAGCITYVELESAASHNIDALEKLVVYAMNQDIPYLGLNLPNDTCMSCGWTGEINDKCPACSSTDIKRLRRVTGYITEDFQSSFNAGKIDEVYHRVKHVGKITNA